ncbi:hypothetical protein [Fusobacterium polymorphum]|uniref:hypothetical protein n=1 Tax=Fusobacterium nucleatum subsp. polymorphum TaxID=76857 RepID=UPI0030D206C0
MSKKNKSNNEALKVKENIKTSENNNKVDESLKVKGNTKVNVEIKIPTVDEILKDEKMKEEIKKKLMAELSEQIQAIKKTYIDEKEKLEKKTEELKEKENSLEKEIKEKQKKLEDATKDLRDLEKEIKEKNKIQEDLKKKKDEIEELKEKQQEKQQELKDATKDLGDLEKKIKEKKEKRDLLLREIDDKEIKRSNLESVVKNLEDRREHLDLDIEKITKEQEAVKYKIVSSHEEEAKQEIEKLNKKIAELKETKSSKEELLKKEADLNIKEKILDEKEEEIDKREESINELREEIREEEKIKIKEKIDSLEEVRELREENSDANTEIRRLENINADSFSKKELNARVKELEKEKKELEEKLLGKWNLETDKIEILKNKIHSLEESHKEIGEENKKLYSENMQLIQYKDKIEIAERTLPELERSKESLIALIAKKDEEINELKSRQMSEVAKRETIEQSYFTIEEKENDKEIIDEIEWLNNIKNSFKEVGFKFSDRLLYAFHTSLKVGDWNPLTVLAGVSGTGKSELPRLYSRYGGLNFLPLAVQSNWDSPYSLFGYYNSLEGKFNATSLLKVLYQAQEDAKNSISDYLTIVLLDEMNLAHVELYFSELLSKLELLRGSEDVKLEIDIAEKSPYEIKLNKNVIWVGTMNEDETTKSLSDKVIDRSNLINFPRPNEFFSRNELKELEEAPKLKRELWESWKWNDVKNMLIQNETTKEENIKIINDFEEEILNLKEKMEEINGYLKFSGRAIGHRVWQSIENYIRNYPLVLESIRNRNSEELEKAIQIAFEDALVQKLMPKLKGLETEGLVRKECLEEISSKIKTYANGIAPDFDNSLNNPYGVFVWNSSEYLLDKNDK